MQRLVTIENAEARPTPVLLLGTLREIDPLVELVYPGECRWWLGAVRPNEERAARGRNILRQMERMPEEVLREASVARYIMLGKLALQGFAIIETYVGPDPSGTVTVNAGSPDAYECSMLEDFRERDSAFRRDGGEANVLRKIRLACGEGDEAAFQAEVGQYLATDGRDHYRREVRHRTMFGAAGMTGGGRILLSH